MYLKQQTKIIIIPGWGGNKKSWKKFVEKANAFFDVEVIELPCFGDEPCPTEVWGIEEYAEFVKKKLVTHYQLPVTILGHSFGGQIATYLTAKNPELIDKLILSGAAIYRPKKILKRCVFTMIAKSGHIITALPGLRRFQNLAKKILYKIAQSPDYTKTSDIQKDIYTKIIRQDISHLLENITIKTLVIWGDKDKHVALKYGKKIAQKLPHAELKIIKKGTHGLHIKKINEFLHTIKDFLE